jgi:hypothetical protein
MTSFPKGRCSLGDLCNFPQHELRKHCPGCDGWIHALCGRVLEEDEAIFKADSVVCPSCDARKTRSIVGMKSPRKSHQGVQDLPLSQLPPGSYDRQHIIARQIALQVQQQDMQQERKKASRPKRKRTLQQQPMSMQPEPLQPLQPMPIQLEPFAATTADATAADATAANGVATRTVAAATADATAADGVATRTVAAATADATAADGVATRTVAAAIADATAAIAPAAGATTAGATAASATQQPSKPQPMQQQTKQRKRKKSIPPKTTGRKNDKNDRVKIKIRRRVKMGRFQLYHILTSDEQRKMIPKDIPNKHNFFGTVVSRGNNKSSWNVRFDILPLDQNVIQNISRTKLTVVNDGEEEKPYDDTDKLDEVAINSDVDESSPVKKKTTEDEFCNANNDSLSSAMCYNMQWGPDSSDVVEWKILKDSEFVMDDDCPFDIPDTVEFSEVDQSQLDDPCEFFFKYIFPDITGK